MGTLSYKTASVNTQNSNKEWLVVDAENMVLGRLCTRIANLLRGKHKPCYTPHADCGDNVIVINADKIRFTGDKLTDKVYVRHTGYPGGQRFTTPKEVLAKFPKRIVEHAIKGMLPKNRLGRQLYRNLRVYASATHPHQAQEPREVNINSIR